MLAHASLTDLMTEAGHSWTMKSGQGWSWMATCPHKAGLG
jgi:hypothetical protein